MGQRTVTAVRRRSSRARRRSVRRSLAASGLVPTYDLLYGSQCGLLYESAVLESGFHETDHAWWPTEERSLHAEGAVFREGQNGALYRLGDGTLVLAHLTEDAIRLSIAGPSRAAVQGAFAAFRGLYPASFVTTEGDSRVPITFWANSQYGPRPRLRRIDATSWEPIVGNYSAAVRDELAALMAWDEPGKEGQLILWQGPPGTGKTWALRALASEWARWAEFNYITDPDSFFVDDPSYMVEVLLSDSYSVMDPSDGSVFEEQPAEGKWRVLILEDTGELLSANAKEKYGQGLSRLLNVVDGMIGQGLRVLCLVTTNDELGELNEAVRRPGRCASQIVFGPLSDEEAQAWTGTPDATAGTIAELYSKYGRADVEARDASFADEPEEARDLTASAPFARPIRTHDDAIDEGIAWGEYHAGRGPKPIVAAATDVRAEIARVAEEHEPDGGYGETAWHEGDRVVFWVSADWSSNEEVQAAEDAFLAIDGVDGLEHDAEAALPIGGGWEQIWPAAQDSLEAVVALASEPLEIEPDVEELAAAVVEAVQPPPLEVPLTTSGLIDVLGKFAERDQPPAPIFNLHFPQHLGVTLERQDVTVPITVEPTPPTPLEVHSHVEVPAQEPPTVTVLAADPAPVQVDVHVPEQPAPKVEVTVPAPARPSAVRVEFDERGHKVYVPVHDDEPEATT